MSSAARTICQARAVSRRLPSDGRLPPSLISLGWARWLRAMAAIATIVLALSATEAEAAKERVEPTAPAVKSYILPYALVVLCMGFGIMVVCRPGNRLDKEKMSAKEEFEDSH